MQTKVGPCFTGNDFISIEGLDHQIFDNDTHTTRIVDLDKLNMATTHNGGLVLGSSQFPLLPQLLQK